MSDTSINLKAASESDAEEEDRLAALRELKILDTDPEDEYDRITRLARIAFGTGIAALSLVDRDRQWFKSITGLHADETPRSEAFCSHTIRQDKPFVVLDASQDERFVDNPLVTGGPEIRFYAGAPIRTSSGKKIGSLCVIDNKVRRSWSNVESGILLDLAALVSKQIQAREKVDELQVALQELSDLRRALGGASTIDPLTGLLDRRSLSYVIECAKDAADASDHFVALLFIDVGGCSEVNEHHGEAAGDCLLKTTAERIVNSIRASDSVLRYSGDQFVAVLSGLESTSGVERPIRQILDDCTKPVAVPAGQSVSAQITIGVGFYPHNATSTLELLADARQAMILANEAGGDCCVLRLKGKEPTLLRPNSSA